MYAATMDEPTFDDKTWKEKNRRVDHTHHRGSHYTGKGNRCVMPNGLSKVIGSKILFVGHSIR